MNHIMMAAVILLSAVTAFAYPKVGDHNTYEGYYLDRATGNTQDVTYEIKVVAKQKGRFLVKEEFFNGAQFSHRTTWMSDLPDQAEMQDYVTHCAQNGGIPEQIDVPFATYESCQTGFRNQEGRGHIWYADVPFGFVTMSQLSWDNRMELYLYLTDSKEGK